MTNTATLTLIAALLTPVIIAQDPPAPPGGFAIQSQLDVPIPLTGTSGTLMNAYYPAPAPPATGWPTVLLIHGGGGNRNSPYIVPLQQKLAAAGYVALSYDTRGGGNQAKVLHMAELIVHAEGLLGPLMDDQRLAMTGGSGGGRQTFWAASYSGLALPTQSAVATHMPTLAAAIPDLQVMDSVEDNIPGGVMVRSSWAVTAMKQGGVNHPTVQQINNGQYASLRQSLANDPVENFFPRLQQQDVPLLVINTWDDGNHQLNHNADRFPLLRPGVPRRWVLCTGGHGSVFNDIETEFKSDMTVRWCDRFLKGIANRVDQEPFAELSVQPADPTVYQDPTSEWAHRDARSWPSNTPVTTLYLRAGGLLSSAAPTATENGGIIQHRVAAGYDAITYLNVDRANPARVVQKIPHVVARFDGSPLSVEREIFGRTVCEFEMTVDAPDYQIQAALWHIPPQGPPVYITSGVVAERGVNPGQRRVRVEMTDVAYVVPAGHTLRLELGNLPRRQRPGNDHFWVLPEFSSADLTIHIDPSFAPRVELPITSQVTPGLTPRLANDSAADGIAHTLRLSAGPAQANELYQVFISASGTWPGVPLVPHFPLNFDAWSLIGVAAANSPVFASFIGQTDANGDATATFNVPAAASAAFAGIRFDFATIVVAGGTALLPSHAATLTISP